VLHPGDLLAGVEAEGQAGIEGEGRVLADVEIGQGVGALDRAALDCVEHLGPADDLAGREDLDLPPVVRHGRDALRDVRAAAVERVEAFGIA
jgi:hypothetical protein